MRFFEWLASKFPNLDKNLKMAEIDETKENFIKKIFMSSFYMTFSVYIFIDLILLKNGKSILIPTIGFPIVFILFFFYMNNYLYVKKLNKSREIDKNLIFLGRHMIIAMSSGIPIYNALLSVSTDYGEASKEIKKIINDTELGKSLEDAIRERAMLTPSRNMKRILWQILNSLRTGTDISSSLTSVINQLSNEQMINIKNYGKKINPIAMFYMVLAVILPSLGISMLIIFSSFFPIPFDFKMLIFIGLFLSLIQLMFVSFVKSIRPVVSG